MRRQQTLLLAIRQQLGPDVILNAPALFGATMGTAWTDLSRDALPALVELFGKTEARKVAPLRIVPPTCPEWLTAAWVSRIRQDVAALIPGLPEPRTISVPRPVATPRLTPRPTPRPTRKPTPKPTAAPTSTPPGPTPEPTPEPTPDP